MHKDTKIILAVTVGFSVMSGAGAAYLMDRFHPVQDIAPVVSESKPRAGLITVENGPLVRADVPQIVMDTLLTNPQIVADALLLTGYDVSVNSADAERADLPADIQYDSGVWEEGDLFSDQIVHQFFDYNCPHCKASKPVIDSLLRMGGVKVVYHELPILGESSELAARAALAAKLQGNYKEMHTALMETPKIITQLTIENIAERLKLDKAKLINDMRHGEVNFYIERGKKLAEAYHVKATPGYVINGNTHLGVPTLDKLRSLLETP